jgi:alpha-mannosidase
MKQQYHVHDFIRPETIQNKPLSTVFRAMRKKLWRYLIVSAAVLPLCHNAHAQTTPTPDISKTPTLFVVPYAHLDTQWRWEFPQVISEYLLKTMRVNFDYMDKYPHYVFNWTGSNRYMLMKEYYPGDYARIKQYVVRGQWFPAGSSVEEGDVNLPDAEGIFRQILYRIVSDFPPRCRASLLTQASRASLRRS